MLDNAAKVATTAGEDIATGLTSLLNNMESLASGFASGAGTAAQTSAGEVGDHLRKLLDALNTMADGVTRTNRAYIDTDAGARQEIADVAGNFLPSDHVSHVSNTLRGIG